MFRCREPLRKVACSGIVRHSEVMTNESTGKSEIALVNDCEPLQPVEDFDFDLQSKAGENVQEVSTLIKRGALFSFAEPQKTEDEP